MNVFQKIRARFVRDSNTLVLGDPSKAKEAYLLGAQINPKGFRTPSVKFNGDEGKPSPRGNRKRARRREMIEEAKS